MSQVTYDILRATYGSGRGAPGLISVIAIGTYSTGLVSAAGTSRKLWAMATDGFVPPCLNRVSATTRVPVRAAAVATAATLAPGLLILAGEWAASASLSYTLVAINASYLLPVVLRLLPSSAAGYDAITRRVGLEGGFTLGRARCAPADTEGCTRVANVASWWVVQMIGSVLAGPPVPVTATAPHLWAKLKRQLLQTHLSRCDSIPGNISC
jgi:amino acid transporter